MGSRMTAHKSTHGAGGWRSLSIMSNDAINIIIIEAYLCILTGCPVLLKVFTSYSGVILHAMVCGRLPFREKSIPGLLREIRSPFKFPSSPMLSDECKSLIKHVLTIDAFARATIRDMQHHDWMYADFLKPARPAAQLKSPTTSSSHLLAPVAGSARTRSPTPSPVVYPSPCPSPVPFTRPPSVNFTPLSRFSGQYNIEQIY